MIRGRARRVEDPEEQARALQALMERLQPEGGHEPIEAQAPLYQEFLRATAVVAIEIEQMSGKFKLGQSLTAEVREAIVRGLEERDAPGDRETVRRIHAAIGQPTHVRRSRSRHGP